MGTKFKVVNKVIQGVDTSDGDGVKIKRIIGSPELNLLDPFLLLDEFKNEKASDYVGGFPPHPHRGFETVTYMVSGNFTHEDSRGNKGHLKSGSVQWMTAGRGIVHSEMPAQDNGLIWGFQLWLNLPAKDKLTEPKYQDIPAEKIPTVEKNGVSAKVIAGEFLGSRGPGQSFYPFTYLDVTLTKEAVFELAVPGEQNNFCYVITGPVQVGPPEKMSAVESGKLAVLSDEGEARIVAGPQGARFLFVAGQRLNEPVARAGPFVMNTKAEILQAFSDYENGKLGRD